MSGCGATSCPSGNVSGGALQSTSRLISVCLFVFFSPSGSIIKINMDVSDKAKRIMVSAVEKLKHSRAQRGGLRLHRTLLLTLAIRSARDLFYAAQMVMETQMTAEPSAAPSDHPGSPSSAGEAVVSHPRDPSCGGSNKGGLHMSSFAQPHRKRRAKTTTEPDFLPCKKARVEPDSGTQQPPASPG